MEKFTSIQSKAVLLEIDNVDTDQIIPARYLKTTDRKGFGANLFRDWRYNKDNNLIASFPLNKHKGEILIAGNNFGCGSSREHAAWALYDYGFKVVLSTFFADIFKNNALNNGLLAIELNKENYEEIYSLIKKNPDANLEVDLENQSIRCNLNSLNIQFEISRYKKECLLNGFDDLDFLSSKLETIKRFESKQQI